MNVYFLPDYTSSNPYQDKLADALNKQGVNARIISGWPLLPLTSVLFQKDRPDIIHVHWPEIYIRDNRHLLSIIKGIRYLVELAVLKLSGIKLVRTVHNLISHEPVNRNLELFFHRKACNFYDHFIIHCQTVKDNLTSTYQIPTHRRAQITTIPHGNYLNTYSSITKSPDLRDKLGLSPNKTLLLYFGNIRPYKQVPLLIKTFRKLNDPETHLLIAGNPKTRTLKKELLKYCHGDTNIHTRLEFIPDEDVSDYFEAADAVVFPFAEIFTSGSVLLAMSFAKAVVAPSLGCLRDTLDNEGSIRYNPNEQDSLLKALQNLSNRDLQKMGEHNLRIAEKLNWEKIAERTRNVYQRL